MSIFAIFAIVLTLGYVLYYVAMISLDLAAQGKKKGDEAETIDTGNVDDDFSHTPKSVFENAETGGFGFSTEEPVEESRPIIFEADDEPVIPEVPDHTNENDDEIPNENEGSEAQSEEQTAEEPEESPTEEPQADETEEAPSEEEETEDDDDSGLVTVEYQEEQEEQKPELFDANQAFDSSLTQPKFGVSKLIEPSASPEVQQKANNVNDAMEQITRLGNQQKPLVLANLMRNKVLSEQNNLYTRDEVTKQ